MEIENMISEVDADRSGTIEFNEFLIMMNKTINENEEEQNMGIPFNLIDKHSNEKITSEDFKHFMHSMGEKIDNPDLIDEIFAEFGFHGDGSLTMDEFQRLMT